jgi:hypothetical protein
VSVRRLVFRSNKPKIANFRADYAKHADFCDLLKNDMKSLYLLAFLLTANHQESQQCFVWAVEEAFKEQAVFKDGAREWLRRRLIKNAIEIVCRASDRNGQISGVEGNARRKEIAESIS